MSVGLSVGGKTEIGKVHPRGIGGGDGEQANACARTVRFGSR